MTDELERRAHDARTLAADISHEFKTPLTGIRGAAELLRDGADRRSRGARPLPRDDPRRRGAARSPGVAPARARPRRGRSRRRSCRSTSTALARACAAPQLAGRRRGPASPATRSSPAATRSSPRRSRTWSRNATQHADPDTTVAHRGRSAARRHPRHGRQPRPGAVARRARPGVGPVLLDARRRRWLRPRARDRALGRARPRRHACGVDCADGVTAFWLELPAIR